MKKRHTPKPVEATPDFPQLEKKLLKYWYESGIVEKYLGKNKKSKKRFSFIDGPITANNPMGVHHGWGRTYKDLWQRFYNQLGMKQRFQNGFDAQGLWVEVEVEKELGFKTKKEIENYGVAKFVQKCKDRVKKYSQIQTEQSKRLGYFMDWDNSYYTHSDENNYMIWHFLKVCNQHGWLYKGKDSVPWCPRCETAISQHEMLTEDYKEVTHESIFFELPIIGRKREFLLVWTTTPWTIPANIAVAVDEKLDYVLLKGLSGDKFWLAKDTVNRVFGGNHKGIIKTRKGKKLVGLRYKAPFDHLPAVKKIAGNKKFHIVLASDPLILPVTTEEGTGLVHTAVSAGTEDFRLGKKLGLPMVPVIADNADYLPGLGFLSGKNAKNNPRLILDYLERGDKREGANWVFEIHNYTHRYPVCWRCKTELVWKVTDEWYISMDKPARSKVPPIRRTGKSPSNSADRQKSKVKTLRERMIEVAKKIRWIPEFGLDRELDWLTNMQDWLISKKNRYWGLCLPIWECDSCGSFQVIGSREELKAKAIKGWDEFEGKSPHKPQIDKIKIRCPNCKRLISRIEPVGNPWLDAGIVPFSTIASDNQSAPLYKINRRQWRKWFPADFITESFPGQFKNWFYSLIAMSTVLENAPPIKTVLGFATLLGEDGRPMHKSWGNAIEFNEGADNIGVDVMRWMYVRQDPSENLLFGYQAASLVRRQFHLILWNSYRFLVNNLALQKPRLSEAKPQKSLLDRWIYSRLNSTVLEVSKGLSDFNSLAATKHLEKLVQDFSTWYVRRSRERVAPYPVDSGSKLGFYFTAIDVLTSIAKLLAPFTPFIAEEIYTNLTGEDSVHLTSWPTADLKAIDSKLEKDMELTREIVELGHGARKKAGIKVRQPLKSILVTGCAALNEQLTDLIEKELNLKAVEMRKRGKALGIRLDTSLTPQLLAEGEARELIRRIQEERKKLGTKLDEEVLVTAPKIPEGFAGIIAQKTLASSLTQGEKFKVVKAD